MAWGLDAGAGGVAAGEAARVVGSHRTSTPFFICVQTPLWQIVQYYRQVMKSMDRLRQQDSNERCAIICPSLLQELRTSSLAQV
jgi:hypothetical protein